MNDSFQPSEIGLIACGSTMGNLLRFIQREYSTRSHTVKKSFGFLVQVVGSTVFLIRRENPPTKTMPEIHGYWHGFMEKQTAPVRWMNMLVRYEADGFLPHPREDLEAPCTNAEQVKGGDMMEEDLTADTKDLVVDKCLKVMTGTRTSVPLSALFDLKTRTLKSKRRDILKEQLPRLWIRQMPYFIIVYHEIGSGYFHPVDTKISNVTEAIVEWKHTRKMSSASWSR
ncbi:hypothetical protein E6O75_ATG07744 [Venturia nashicola]|uniref:Uncharacterized protein n=1 Tax=Venturia nashicola TaxID=86259 RepID=A0A4Z1PCM7_9PEZI|nr:hypothetical protein E6O75_ATG07744 [Venturia nashicola]